MGWKNKDNIQRCVDRRRRPPRRRSGSERGLTDPETLSQLLPVALLRSQHSLQGMLDRPAHVIQRFRQFARGGRLNLAGQDLPDRTGEDVRVGQDENPAGTKQTPPLSWLPPEAMSARSAGGLTTPGRGKTRSSARVQQ